MRTNLIKITHISQYVVSMTIFLRLMKKSCVFNKIVRGIMTRQLVIIIFFFSLCVFRVTSKEKQAFEGLWQAEKKNYYVKIIFAVISKLQNITQIEYSATGGTLLISQWTRDIKQLSK